MLNDIEVEIVLKAKEVTGYDPTDDYQSFYEPHKEYGFHKFIEGAKFALSILNKQEVKNGEGNKNVGCVDK